MKLRATQTKNRNRSKRTFNVERLENRQLMSTYYVSTAGSDAATGTSATPWQTLQKAVTAVKAGDIVSVKAGTYNGFIVGWDGPINGTAAAPITFKADPGVIINTPNNKTRDGISVENCNYIVIDGFTIQPNSTDLNWRSGIRMGGGGIGNVARNNTVLMRSQDTQGIFSSFNQNQVVEYNEVSGNQDAGIYCSNSAINPTVRGNYVHDLSTVSGQGVGIHFNGDVGQGGIGIIDGGLVEGNRVVNCGTGISMDGMQNATVRNNVLQDIHGKGINLYMSDASDASKNDVVVNNTIDLASDGYFSIGVRFGSTNVKVLNNIGLNGSRSFVTDPESASGLVVDYNIWGSANFSSDNDSSWMNFSSWQATGNDTHSKTSTAAALFVSITSDLHLLGSAPAINTGTSTSAPGTDFDGNARPAAGAYDIGAFEFGGVVVPPTAPAAPTALSATAASAIAINLTWSDNANNETAYKIERSTAGGSFVQIAAVGAEATSYSDTGLTPSTAYTYRVRATNAVGDSAYSNSASATTPVAPPDPSAPSALTATANSSSQVSLNWKDNSGLLDLHLGFKVERSTAGGAFTEIATVLLGTSYTDNALAGSTTYAYRVSAIGLLNNSGYSNTATVTTPVAPTAPVSPSQLTATATSSTSIALTWIDNSDNETNFRLGRSTDGITFVQIATLSANTTGYIDTGLTPNTTYTYRVRSYNAVGNSFWANLATAQTSDLAPAAPTSLAATVNGTSQISLAWTDNSTNETAFKIERSTAAGAYAQIATVGAGITTYVDSTLTAGTTYTYRVRATSAIADSAYSNTATATTTSAPTAPAAPSALVATANSTSQISLAWTDNSDNETAFRLERQNGDGTFSPIATLGAGVTTFVDSGLSASTSYAYQVIATNAIGDSASSNIAQATTQTPIPAAASNVTAVATSSTSVTVSWTDNAANETGYRIDRTSITDNGIYSLLTTTTANVTSFIDNTVQGNGTYTYRISALGTAGSSDYAYSASVITPAAAQSPVSPSQLTATATGSSTIALTWIDNSDNETYFRIDRASDGINFVQIAMPAANATSYADSGLNPNTTYTYRIRAYNGPLRSFWSNLSAAKTADLPPATPTGLTATLNANQVALTWTDKANNETGYRVQRSTNGTDFAEVAALPASTTSWTDTTVVPGESYSYRIQAVGLAGTSGFSNASNVTLSLVAPDNLTATANGASTINLTWQDHSANETGFVIERSESGGSFTAIATTAADATTYTDNTLSPLTIYTYRISAINAVSTSPVSSSASATTTDVPPAAPTNLSATADIVSVTLNWTDNASNETSYSIERSISNGSFIQVATVGAGVTTWTDADVLPGEGYTYRVAGIGTAGASAYSNAASAALSLIAPDALTATANGAHLVDLTWSDNSGNESSYIVERSANGIDFIVVATLGANVTSFTDSGLSALTTYTYRVSASNAVAVSAASTAASATTTDVVPLTPANLIAAINGARYIDLKWSDNASNETAYIIERSTMGTEYVQVTQLQPGSSNWTDFDVMPLTTYAYRVTATGTAGSATSDVATATTLGLTPTALSALSATPVDVTRVDLSWTTNDINAKHFAVFRMAEGSNWEIAANLDGSARSFTDTGVLPGTKYLYWVNAWNEYGASQSTYVTATTLPDTVAPTASLTPIATITSRTATAITFNVTYTDASLDTTTIGTGDISVTGPKSYQQTATLVSLQQGPTANTWVATYTVAMPKTGSMDGTYTVTLKPDQVLDLADNSAISQMLGTFVINVH
jgi:parallel beta-helix repeat protein